MHKFAKPIVFLVALSPFLWLLFRALTARLTVNPIEDITLTTGIWALRVLVITLAITPVRRLTGWNRVIPYRRMFGLFAFFCAVLHLATYFLDQGFAPEFIIADVLKRRFITVGMLAFALLVPLAFTSIKSWIRRLGKRWVVLHRLVYISGLLAVVHYLWKVKIVAGPPVYYALIVGCVWRCVGSGRSGRDRSRHAGRACARWPTAKPGPPHRPSAARIALPARNQPDYREFHTLPLACG